VAVPTAVLVLVAGVSAPALGVVGSTVAIALVAAASVAAAIVVGASRPARP
jgi:hypothetical protein